MAEQHLSRSPSRWPWLFAPLLALVIAGCSSGAKAPELPPTVAPAQSASLQELQDALEAATEKLYEAAGIEAIEHGYLHGELSRTIWAKSWSNGDFVSVESTDLDVADNGESGGVATLARVRIADMFYTAGTGAGGVASPWLAVEATETPAQKPRLLPVSVPPGLLMFDPEEVLADSATVQRSDATDNSVLWSLEVSRTGEAKAFQYWEFGESGHLATLWMTVDGWPASDEIASPVPKTPTVTIDARQREIVIEFTPLEDPGELTPPIIGEPLDLHALDVPSDLPLTD